MAAPRDRRAYWRAYYLAHRAAIQAKNRQWLEDNRAQQAERRRQRYADDPTYRERRLATNRRAYRRRRAKQEA